MANNRINFVWLHGRLKWDMKEGDDYKCNIRPTSKGGYWAQFEIDIETEAVNKKTGDIVYYHDTPLCRTFNQDTIKMLRGLGKGSEIDIKGELQKRDYKKDDKWEKGNTVVMINKLVILDKKAIGEVDAQREAYRQKQNGYSNDGYYGQQPQQQQNSMSMRQNQPEWMEQLGAEVLYDETKDADVPF